MAQVDFTNAVLHLPQTYNPLHVGYMSMSYNALRNSAGTSISQDHSYTLLTNEERKYVLSYQGVFTASGTEFYFGARNSINECWKITGVSFQAGDAYSFQVPVTLTCL